MKRMMDGRTDGRTEGRNDLKWVRRDTFHPFLVKQADARESVVGRLLKLADRVFVSIYNNWEKNRSP